MAGNGQDFLKLVGKISYLYIISFRLYIKFNLSLRYYATFKLKKIESLFCKINTCLQKNTTCIGLLAEQIFSVHI